MHVYNLSFKCWQLRNKGFQSSDTPLFYEYRNTWQLAWWKAQKQSRFRSWRLNWIIDAIFVYVVPWIMSSLFLLLARCSNVTNTLSFIEMKPPTSDFKRSSPKALSIDGWQAYATAACMEIKQTFLGRLNFIFMLNHVMYYNPSVGTYLGYVSNGQGGVLQLCSTLSLRIHKNNCQCVRPLFVLYGEPYSPSFGVQWWVYMHHPVCLMWCVCLTWLWVYKPFRL